MKNQRIKGPVKRTETIKLRCTILEKKQIERLAESSNLPIAVYLRKRGLNHKISRTLTEDEVKALKLLALYTNSLKRISNLIKHHQPGLVAEIEELVGRIQGWYKEHLYGNDWKG